jgi:hypothetical protein
MTSSVPLQAVRDLVCELEQAQGRQRAHVRRQFMSLYGISDSTLSRALHEVGWRAHERRDRGVRRKPVEDQDLQRLAAIQRASLSSRKGVVMPASDAIEIAEDSGIIEPGLVSESFFNGWLRDHEASRTNQKRPEPYTILRSLGPNHVHQVDFSLAVHWKIFQGRPVYEHLVYKNKLPSTGVPRLWRLIIIDHATGCFFPYYSESTGETVQATLEGLYRAWSAKSIRGESVEKLYPFRGVPRILMADRGSANQAKITSTVLERLGVKLNICQGARSKGSVEGSHNWWEEHFESRMRLQIPESVEQLNEWALDFAIKLCAEKPHTRYGAARSAMWAWHINRREETKLRELSCDFEAFKAIAMSEPQRCLVRGSRTIRFKTRNYRVPEAIQTGRYVAVQYSPFEFPKILIREADVESAPAWLCEPVELDEFGFPLDAPVIGLEFKSHKHTETKRFIAQADEIAGEYIQEQSLRVFGHHRESIEPIEGRQQGEDVLAGVAAEEVRMTRVQARNAVLEALGRQFTRAEVEYINSVLGETVTEHEVEAAIAELQRGVAGRVLSFAGGSR